MKKAVYISITLLIIIGNGLSGIKPVAGVSTPAADSLKIFSAPDLYNLSVKWAEEYNRQFPDARIRVVSVPDQKNFEANIREGNIGFISGDYSRYLKAEPAWNIVVGRDVIVPVINAGNPLLQEICRRGISRDGFASYLKSGDSGTWGDLLKEVSDVKASYYCLDDPSAIKNLASYLRIDESIVRGISKRTSKEVISAVQKDPGGFGFCRYTDVINPKDQSMAENIRFLPVDRNGNGIIDSNEKIYDNVNDFARGIWIGKYPKPLFSNIYSVSSVQPVKPAEVAFLKWVLSEGQAYLPENGYTDLLATERQNAGDRFNNAKIVAGAPSGERLLGRIFLFIIATLVLAGIIVAAARRKKKAEPKPAGASAHNLINDLSMIIPKGLYFDKTHTWAFLEENGTVKVGVDDFLQHVTGKITRIKMKSPGKKVQKGEQILSIIRNGKQLNLYAPVSGTITEQNTLLEGTSELINKSPYREGWIYRIEPSNWSRESQLLFMSEKQKEFIKKEFVRLRDFLMTALGSESNNYPQLALADGGEIRDGVLSDMGPEVWEDFQTNFIDPSRQVWFYEIF